MDVELNVTYVTLNGYVELQKYRYLYFVIMFLAYIAIMFCNSTVVILIWFHKNLHEPMYIFIAALLINSILYSTALYPKILMDFLSEKQIITYSACLFQAFVYYTVAGSEFSLLSAMAYDRYVSICKPLKYPTIMSKVTVNVCLALAWLIPACEFAVSVLLYYNTKLCDYTLNGIFCNNSGYKHQCVTSIIISIYGLVLLITVLILPLFFILFTYTRILIIVFQGGKEVRRKAAKTCLPHLLVLMNFSCFVTYDVITVRMESDFPKTVRFVVTLLMLLFHPLINPIVYGVKMKEISKHLKRMLCWLKSH
ncbi:olfactory receptor 52A5-like [Parambassis ranga]|uniref:Olfactory receptor n=1 Tax=Parambassis ranga TaxID=210632 RepID=A0A6P7H5A7_9TELE|nr:olfactory receptor 52A5-like [Parambassis ranga]